MTVSAITAAPARAQSVDQPPPQSAAADGPDKEQDIFFNFQVENDLWGSGADNHYTHGTRLSVLFPRSSLKLRSAAEEAVKRTAEGLVNIIPEGFEPDTKRIGIILGQNIFTPNDISRTDLISEDRPFAGWLYMGVALTTETKGEKRDTMQSFELDIGIVGPHAFAEDVQKKFHELINTRKPNGWSNQLRDEIGVVASYEQKWPIEALETQGPLGTKLDITPSAGAALGNVYTYVAAGATVRFGNDLPNDYGPPRIRPGLQGSGFFKAKDKFAWYVFAGLEGRAVARNIFLDGNTFRESHRVDKKPIVGDFQFGVVLTFKHARMAFTNVFRTKEFYGQRKFDEFGSFNISWRF